MPIKFPNVEGEFEKDKQLKREDLTILRDWLNKQSHLPNIEDLKLICFLYNAYCNIEKAKVFLENLYTARTHAPEMLLNKDINDKLFCQTIKMGLMTPLPHRTDEGYLVFYLRLMDTNSDLLNFNSAIKTFDMTTWLYQLQEGIAPGHVLILDSEGFSFGHATKINFATCMKLAHYLQECFPHRIKSINIINVSPITEKLFVFVKPLIKKEFVDIIYFHPKIDTLYNFVPKRIMPKEYGGESPCFKDLHDSWVQNMKDNVKFFEQENLEYTDENKRIGKQITTADIFGIEGTFRKLDID